MDDHLPLGDATIPNAIRGTPETQRIIVSNKTDTHIEMMYKKMVVEEG